MALEKSRFFDSVGDDRIYQADNFAEYFRLLLTDGIKNGGTNLKVTAPGTGMTVRVNYGEALIQGYAYWLTNDGAGIKTLAIGAAASQPRIDRVVLRLDRSLSARQVSLVIKPGSPASNPIPPALTRTNNIYELSLARIRVNAGVSKIEASNITDERFNASVCGLINSLITLDGSDFQAQAEAIIEQLANQGYLPLDGKAADSDLLDGIDSTGFAASSHTHSISNVSGLQDALDGKAASSHTHSISNVSGLQSALDGKAASSHSHSAYANKSHTHSISNVSGLQDALDGKAASSHTHSISNVSGLQSALDGKAASSHSHSAYANKSHTHSISNVSGLQSALDGKEPKLAAARKRLIYVSANDPSGGADGDIWIKLI